MTVVQIPGAQKSPDEQMVETLERIATDLETAIRALWIIAAVLLAILAWMVLT